MISSAYKYVIATICVVCFCYAFFEMLCWFWAKRLEWSGEASYSLADELMSRDESGARSSLSSILLKLQTNVVETTKKSQFTMKYALSN